MMTRKEVSRQESQEYSPGSSGSFFSLLSSASWESSCIRSNKKQRENDSFKNSRGFARGVADPACIASANRRTDASVTGCPSCAHARH